MKKNIITIKKFNDNQKENIIFCDLKNCKMITKIIFTK